MAAEQIKSRARIDAHGEVFTAEREVRAMCDLVRAETARPESRFLEPACGTGNFLAEVLSRKLAAVGETAAGRPGGWARASLAALGSIYGVELLADNCAECRARLLALWDAAHRAACSADGCAAVRAAARRILSRNIVCGNALTLRRTDADGADTAAPITLCEWTFPPDGADVCAAPSERELSAIRFDVILSNPPYQRKVNEGGRGLGAVPIYQKFVEQAMRLRPRYLCMIIPSRWFTGGVGLQSFRKRMLSNRQIRTMVDYTDAKDCFPGVDVNGGICYFLMDFAYSGQCEFTNITNGAASSAMRELDEFEIFVRRNEALPILRKVLAKAEPTLAERGGCSPQTPYGFLSTYSGRREMEAGDCALLSSRGWSYVARACVQRSAETIDLYKPMLSKLSSEHAGNPDRNGRYRVLSRMEILRPNQICSQSYLTVCPQPTAAAAEHVFRYLRTALVRFLILQTMVGMNLSADNFRFVPRQDFTRAWTDADLYEKYGLTPAEIACINATIKPMPDAHGGGSFLRKGL